jgi:hypothetical protein
MEILITEKSEGYELLDEHGKYTVKKCLNIQ